MKICSACKIEKDDNCYYNRGGKCKDCKIIYQKMYYIENKDGSIKKYKEENKDSFSEKNISTAIPAEAGTHDVGRRIVDPLLQGDGVKVLDKLLCHLFFPLFSCIFCL